MRLLVAPVCAVFIWTAAPLARGETHAAVGSRVELNLPLNPRYPGTDGAQTLVDGETGSVEISRQYLGFEGPDVEVTVHLPVETTVRTIAVDFSHHPTPAIFLPMSVDFACSRNGTNFATVATVLPKTPEREMTPTVERIEVSGLDLNVRAIRIRASNGGLVPSWHRAPHALRWIFVSEVLVNPGEAPRSPADLLKAYRFGASRWALVNVEAALRAGSPDKRRELCDDLKGLLADSEATTDARRFALQQLAAFGQEGGVPAVAALLDNAELRGAACRTLAAIGGEAAEEALLAVAEGGESGAADAALTALGRLRSPRVIPIARRQLSAEARRSVALAVLREQGTVAAAEVLCEALESASGTWRDDVAGCLVSCGRHLLSSGEVQQASRVFEAVRQSDCAPSIRAGALAGIVRTGKHELIPELLALTQHVQAGVRRAALSLTVALVGDLGVQPVSELFADLPVRSKAALINVLGGSGRESDATWLRERHVGEEAEVRAAVFRALGRSGDASDVVVLGAGMSDDATVVARSAGDALCRLSGSGVDDALLEVAGRADEDARDAFCEVFVRRGTGAAVPLLLTWGVGADKRQRRSAWGAVAKLAGAGSLAQQVTAFLRLPPEAAPEARKALLAAVRYGPHGPALKQLEQAFASCPSDMHRAVLLAVLGDSALPESHPLLVKGLTHPGLEVRAAAVRALATCPDPRAVHDLLGVGKSESEAHVRILALRSALAGLRTHGARMSARERNELLRASEAMSEREEERIMVVQTAGAVPCEAAFSIAVVALESPALRDAAEVALLSLAPVTWLDAGVAVRNALLRLAAEGGNEERRTTAGELLQTLPSEAVLARIDAIPWLPIFNGQDLSGWQIVNGQPDSWFVRDGLLVARKGGGGWLARTEELSDYAVEFEFSLPPGGNSGFFLRPPLSGNPAWEGMEIQILDDASPTYAKLRPDQYCAGIYGMVGADPRVSRGAGEWQQMRILCIDRLVSVWLNGRHVAQADLEQHMDKADKIRGLRQKSGFPGLQNEHGPIEFRSVRMKRLD